MTFLCKHFFAASDLNYTCVWLLNISPQALLSLFFLVFFLFNISFSFCVLVCYVPNFADLFYFRAKSPVTLIQWFYFHFKYRVFSLRSSISLFFTQFIFLFYSFFPFKFSSMFMIMVLISISPNYIVFDTSAYIFNDWFFSWLYFLCTAGNILWDAEHNVTLLGIRILLSSCMEC